MKRIKPERPLTKAEKAARWRAAHPEKAAEVAKRYREKNSAKRAASALSWRLANSQHVLEYQQQYEDDRRKIRSAEKRASYSANPQDAREKSRLWRVANPLTVKAHKQKRRTRKLAAQGSHTQAETAALLQIQNSRCANPYCGCILTKVNWSIDHVIALTEGGSNAISNLQWLCQPCNLRKSNLSVENWLDRERQRIYLMKEQENV